MLVTTRAAEDLRTSFGLAFHRFSPLGGLVIASLLTLLLLIFSAWLMARPGYVLSLAPTRVHLKTHGINVQWLTGDASILGLVDDAGRKGFVNQ